LAERGVLAIPFTSERLRFATHHDVTAEDVDEALRIIRDVV